MVIRVKNAQRMAWAALAIGGIALAGAGLFAGREAMQLRKTAKAKPQTQLPPAPQSPQRLLPFASYVPVLSNNIFGFDAGRLSPLFGGGPRPENASAQAPAPSTINLRVLGTIAEDTGIGYAIIADAAGTQDLYRTGDEIPGTGKLLKVYPSKVVVESGGRRHEVSTVSLEAPPAVPTASASPAQGGFVRRTGADEFVVNRTGVDESISNPKRLLTDARLLPHYDEAGTQDGFVVSEVKAGGLYSDLGLQNGDVLMGVNGLALKTPESALQAFAALKGMNRISLDIIRNNTKATLTYNIR